MSDTPRTDAATKTYIWNGVKHIFVEADVVRQLERELSAVTADLCAFAVDMEKQLSAVTAEREEISLRREESVMANEQMLSGLSASQQEVARLREALETTHKCMQLFSSFLDHWSIKTNRETHEVYKAWDDARETAGTNEQQIVAALASTLAPAHKDMEKQLSSLTAERDALKEGIDLVDKMHRKASAERDALKAKLATINHVAMSLFVRSTSSEVTGEMAEIGRLSREDGQ